MKGIVAKFHNLSIKYKLACVILPGMVALLYFNSLDILDEYANVKEMERMRHFANIAQDINAAVHEFQKERGATAIFVSSAGAKFGPEMKAQRTATDKELKDLTEGLSAFHEKELDGNIKEALGFIARVEGFRKSVDAFVATPPEVVKFYSELNAGALRLIGEMTHEMGEGEIENHFTGFYAAQMLKEPMGVERALLANAFTSDKMAPPAYKRLVEIITEQETYKKLYMAVMPDDDNEVLQEFYKDPIAQKTLAIRETALQKWNEGGFNVDPAEWFQAQTAKINLLNDKVITGHLKKELFKVTERKMAAAKSELIWVVAVSAVIFALTTLVAVSIILGLIKTIRDTSAVVDEIAKGDFTHQVPVESRDEIGALAENINNMVAELRGMFTDIRENSKTLAASSEELSAVSSQLAAGSERMTGQANGVAGATEQMSMNINSMASGVEEASVNAATVSSTAEEMSANMRSIASAIEEMSITIREVARHSEDTSKVAGQAMDMSRTASETMRELGRAANEIGKVTDMIKRIAEQTNLLALNATIEAASAGDAGKGFAVVANEIKELANQSARAAEDIAAKIGGIQGSTGNAVKAISAVAEIIRNIDESVSTIKNAVHQQTSAANEISRNVTEVTAGANNIASSIAEVAKGAGDIARNAGEAAKGANEVSSNILGITKAVAENNSGIRQISGSSRDLAAIASALESMVAKFTVDGNGGGKRELALHSNNDG